MKYTVLLAAAVAADTTVRDMLNINFENRAKPWEAVRVKRQGRRGDDEDMLNKNIWGDERERMPAKVHDLFGGQRKLKDLLYDQSMTAGYGNLDGPKDASDQLVYEDEDSSGTYD